jgi:hypothetical protein
MNTKNGKIRHWVEVGAVVAFLLLGIRSQAQLAAPELFALNGVDDGMVEVMFYGEHGPFVAQMKSAANEPWVEIQGAEFVVLGDGVYKCILPQGANNLGIYRIIGESEINKDLDDWSVTVQISTPDNGLFFTPGEKPVVTLTLWDEMNRDLTSDDFSTLRLYMHGPEEPQLTYTPVKLIKAESDRSVRPHHYIDLRSHPDAVKAGNIVVYPFDAITDEPAGTYTVSIRATLSGDSYQQVIRFGKMQIGTADVETPVVTKDRCAACHLGTDSGKFYLHHVDPRSENSVGSFSLDQDPVQSCKACHNNDGYAAFRDNSVPGGRVADPILRRVHGVHNGSHLERTFNIDPDTGDFADYLHVEFPADVRNCTVCHVDDRWKTQPTIFACTGCHDNVWFGPKADVPEGMELHKAGQVTNDTACAICHSPEGGGVSSIVDVHAVQPPAFKHTVDLTMTPPANGEYYVAGESPQVTITIMDVNTGAVVDPSTLVVPADSSDVQPNEWRRANFYVSGPRANTVPVLTTAAMLNDASKSYASNDLRVQLEGVSEDPQITRTADAIVYQLADVAGLSSGTYSAFAEIMPSAPLGGWGYVTFQVGNADLEPQPAANCVDCHRETTQHSGYFAVTFTPDICKACHDNERQMPDKALWTDRNAGFGAAPLSRRVHGVHYGNYLHKPEEVHSRHDYSHVIFPQDVRNCNKCHSETESWNESASRVACLACHDDNKSIAHASLMTFDLSSEDPWSGDELETCSFCHGPDKELSPKNVHSLSDPYVQPYLREGHH